MDAWFWGMLGLSGCMVLGPLGPLGLIGYMSLGPAIHSSLKGDRSSIASIMRRIRKRKEKKKKEKKRERRKGCNP